MAVCTDFDGNLNHLVGRTVRIFLSVPGKNFSGVRSTIKSVDLDTRTFVTDIENRTYLLPFGVCAINIENMESPKSIAKEAKFEVVGEEADGEGEAETIPKIDKPKRTPEEISELRRRKKMRLLKEQKYVEHGATTRSK